MDGSWMKHKPHGEMEPRDTETLNGTKVSRQRKIFISRYKLDNSSRVNKFLWIHKF